MATSKPTINLELIRKCHETAKAQITDENMVSFRNRVTVQNNEFLMSEIQSEFQAEAYTAYLTGKMGLTEFKALLYFDRPSTLNLLFSMVETQPDHVTLTNLKNMTKQRLTEKLLLTITEFVNVYREKHSHKRRVH